MSMVASARPAQVSLQKWLAASTASVMRSGAVGSSSVISGWSVGLVSQSSPSMVYSPPAASHSWMVSVARMRRYALFSGSRLLGVAEPSGCHVGTCTPSLGLSHAEGVLVLSVMWVSFLWAIR